MEATPLWKQASCFLNQELQPPAVAAPTGCSSHRSSNKVFVRLCLSKLDHSSSPTHPLHLTLWVDSCWYIPPPTPPWSKVIQVTHKAPLTLGSSHILLKPEYLSQLTSADRRSPITPPEIYFFLHTTSQCNQLLSYIILRQDELFKGRSSLLGFAYQLHSQHLAFSVSAYRIKPS